MRSDACSTPISSSTRSESALRRRLDDPGQHQLLERRHRPTASNPSRAYTLDRTCHSSADRFAVITPASGPALGMPGRPSGPARPGRGAAAAGPRPSAPPAPPHHARRPDMLEHDVTPARRSAICTFVLPDRPGDFRTNTTTPTLPTSGVCQSLAAHAADQHKRRPNRRSALKWHESGRRASMRTTRSRSIVGTMRNNRSTVALTGSSQMSVGS